MGCLPRWRRREKKLFWKAALRKDINEELLTDSRLGNKKISDRARRKRLP
jgi:hypothetical protein